MEEEEVAQVTEIRLEARVCRLSSHSVVECWRNEE